jgi:hypothetical protein
MTPNRFDFPDPMCGIHNLFTDFEHSDLLLNDDIAVVRFVAADLEIRLNGRDDIESERRIGWAGRAMRFEFVSQAELTCELHPVESQRQKKN